MRIVLLNTHTPFVRGGAEVLAEGLAEALVRHGHQCDILRLPQTYKRERAAQEILAARCLDLEGAADLAIGLKFPAYLCRHPAKRLWLLHQDRVSYDLWDTPMYRSLDNSPYDPSARQAVMQADQLCLPECQAIFTISKTVSRRLESYCGLPSQPIYPPVPEAEKFYTLPDEPFFFFPSRLAPFKRQRLALEALALADPGIHLVFAGGGTDESYREILEKRVEDLELQHRVTFAGVISEQQKLDYYARCRAVLFPAYYEDYGFVTVEAMLASKPVIVCCDSGGAAELAVHGQTGLICEPEVEAMAEAMTRLFHEPKAAELGRNGRQRAEEVVPGWDQVVETLLGPVSV